MQLHLSSWAVLGLGLLNAAQGLGMSPRATDADANTTGLLQDIVTWDAYSVMVRGERIMFYSGEFHPFRLPSPGLWLDVFQKIKAVGFSGVSFYIDWALLEGAPGSLNMDGVFALDEFFDAATEAGIYLLARPGPYINAETSGGGYPGWVTRIKGPVRTNATDWLDATKNYVNTIGPIIAKAQITNGGPVILFQPENEYTLCAAGLAAAAATGDPSGLSDCLNHYYMADVEAMWRDTGIALPFMFNDATALGNFAPGSGVGEVDIYGFDSYPLGWGAACSNPSSWVRTSATFLPKMTNYTIHELMSPSSPFSIVEYQGGTAEGWGGAGVDSCAALANNEFERVNYKVAYSFRATILNLYMMFGGTNWGNLGHAQGYTSYDVGAAIAEDRQVDREKYSELKLQANFLQVSPGYLTSEPAEAVFRVYTNTSALVTTALTPSTDSGSSDSFYIVRHSDYTSQETVQYTLSVSNVIVPQLGGALTLSGRDSKVHVVNYAVGDITLHYSTAEVMTWKKTGNKTVLVLYGGAGESHEFALPKVMGLPTVQGGNVTAKQIGDSTVVAWAVQPTRRILSFTASGKTLEVHLLWRNEAYNYWVLDLPQPAPVGKFVSASRTNASDTSVIVKAGYLMRNASVSDNTLYFYGDLNQTTTLEVIAAPITSCGRIFFNGKPVGVKTLNGRLTATLEYAEPVISLPDLASLEWSYIDSLPEVSGTYDDSAWAVADRTTTNNTRNLTTPTSLYASDYGFHSGSLIFRGHFQVNATGNQSASSFAVSTTGGNAFGHSVWIDSTYLGSWKGDPAQLSYNQTLDLPALSTGNHVITILVDHMGLAENTYMGVEGIKEPRGILDYSLILGGRALPQSDITWKLTGNLGGEQHVDKTRGPLNEGAMFAERQGYHLPGALSVLESESRSPMAGIDGPGVGFFATTFDLDMPTGYDVPLSFVFSNASTTTPAYRVQLYVNGWQFGKYVNDIGPQTSYPVPEGILNYNGPNYVALTLWSLETGSVKLDGIALEATAVVQSGYTKPDLVEGAVYSSRVAY